MNRKGIVYFQDKIAGTISETEEGYEFQYDENYISENYSPVSLTLPLSSKAFRSKTMFSFFDELISEGLLLFVR